MEQAQTPAATGGGPAPFLLKTYEMVDDCSTDDIVSWSSSNSSFVVWNPPEFSTRLLPTYFKHNNFSSFIRQLNTYGFHKIDPERWEFANDYFIKGKKDLLKNIHRRKPIHSHSQPPLSFADAERSCLEEEIERLQREKAGLQADLWRFKQQQSGSRIQLEDLERRLHDMEQRQAKMVAFLHRAVQNPKFVENLVRMAVSSASAQDLSALHRKRRLPGVAHCAEVAENSFCENSVSSSNSKPAEVGNAFSQDFCDKLKLELCTAISDSNLVSPSTQGSREEDHSPQGRLTTGGGRLLPLVPETLELSDTGASFCPRKCSLLLSELDDGDGLVACHLNLTLASSSMQVESSNHLSRIPSSIDLDATIDIDQCSRDTSKEEDTCNIDGKNAIHLHGLTDSDAPSVKEVTLPNNQTPVPATGRVNDMFWEQFLTERPGSSDTEEASSSLREDVCEEQEEMIMKDNRWRNIKDVEQLTL